MFKSSLECFDLFKAKIEEINSKAPGDTCRGPKGALAQWYGRLSGSPCFRQVSDWFKSHAHSTRRTIVEGCPSPCFLRTKGEGLYLKELCPIEILLKKDLTYILRDHWKILRKLRLSAFKKESTPEMDWELSGI